MFTAFSCQSTDVYDVPGLVVNWSPQYMANVEQRARPPLLLLLKGHPGSGKSTLARQIAANLQMALSDKDDSRDCLKAAETQHGLADSCDLNALAYDIMFRVAETQLSCGVNVVVDCPLSSAQLYHTALEITHKVWTLQPKSPTSGSLRLEVRLLHWTPVRTSTKSPAFLSMLQLLL